MSNVSQWLNEFCCWGLFHFYYKALLKKQVAHYHTEKSNDSKYSPSATFKQLFEQIHQCIVHNWPVHSLWLWELRRAPAGACQPMLSKVSGPDFFWAGLWDPRKLSSLSPFPCSWCEPMRMHNEISCWHFYKVWTVPQCQYFNLFSKISHKPLAFCCCCFVTGRYNMH